MDDDKVYERAKERVEEKIIFLSHLAVYIILNAFLFFLDYRDDKMIGWAYWPLFGWGIGLVMHGLNAFVFGEGSSLKDRMIKKEMEREISKKE
jgi:VanZ family protein